VLCGVRKIPELRRSVRGGGGSARQKDESPRCRRNFHYLAETISHRDDGSSLISNTIELKRDAYIIQKRQHCTTAIKYLLKVEHVVRGHWNGTLSRYP